MRTPRWNGLALVRYLHRPAILLARSSPVALARGNSFHRQHEYLFRSSYSISTRNNPTVAEPTIYALSTAPGKAAIAIVRISGLACVDIYHALCPDKRLPIPRHASIRAIFAPNFPTDASMARVLDYQALVLYFPAPMTVTGEDVLEFHIHGGPAVIKAVLAAVGQCNNALLPVRYAEPGEFTRRAFFNNRMDLTQIEALGETLSAVTEEQRRVAVQGTDGGLADRYESWRLLLLHARGELEALIDFSEDQHFDESPSSLINSVAAQVQSLEHLISYHRNNAVRGELLRNGIGITLIGAPNVGKSSLLNLVVGRNAAIVSKEAGTTRDVVEIGVDLGGFFCRFGDTAGLRQSISQQQSNASSNLATVVGAVELEGIRRAKEKALHSDVVIVMLSIEPSIEEQGAQLSLDAEVLDTAIELLGQGKSVLVVVNKMDNYSRHSDAASTINSLHHSIQSVLPGLDASRIFCVSCQTAENTHSHNRGNGHESTSNGGFIKDPGNLQGFLDGLITMFRSLTSPLFPESDQSTMQDRSATADGSIWHESLGATERQRALLEQCSAHLREFLAYAGEANDIVVAAESLRAAAECLSRITGKGETGDVEQVLGVVFEKFCVGK